MLVTVAAPTKPNRRPAHRHRRWRHTRSVVVTLDGAQQARPRLANVEASMADPTTIARRARRTPQASFTDVLIPFLPMIVVDAANRCIRLPAPRADQTNLAVHAEVVVRLYDT